jgi:hypothetical protein
MTDGTTGRVDHHTDGTHGCDPGAWMECRRCNPFAARSEPGAEGLDVERLQAALWNLMKRDGWRIATGYDDLPPNAVVESIAREYAALAETEPKPEEEVG